MRSATVPDPSAPCVDRKRHAWPLSLAVPMRVGLGPVPHRDWAQTVMLWPPVAFVYCVAPLIGLGPGAGIRNHPDASRIDFDLRRRAAPMRRHGLAGLRAAWTAHDSPRVFLG